MTVPGGTAKPPEVGLPGEVTLILVDSGVPFTLTGRSEYLVGREDVEEGILPDLDLTLSGGENAGVSRRHALILYRDGAFWIQDNNSLNYTFVNGKMLSPKEPYPLQDGDDLWLANLHLRVQLGSRAPHSRR